MTITRDNYEPYFLDFLEGNLEENQIDQFLDFLELNPDLKEELQLLENMTLPEEKITFSGKENLYKSSADLKAATENKMIAHLEGDLDNDERKSFESWLAGHPEQKKEYELFSKTRLIPDATVKFQEKKKLYRKSGNQIILTWVARAAAVVVLLWGINSLFQSENTLPHKNNSKEVASLTPEKEPVNLTKPVKKNQIAEVGEKTNPEKTSAPSEKNSIREKTKALPEGKNAIEEKFPERDLTALAELSPRTAQLESVPVDNQLAFSHPEPIQKINDRSKVMTIDEFLASRAKKVGNEGLLSAHRIIRAGLGIASELSGERIGYKEKDGKITSLDFESKLMAFSIPLKKE
jgi:hypothetical protein